MARELDAIVAMRVLWLMVVSDNGTEPMSTAIDRPALLVMPDTP